MELLAASICHNWRFPWSQSIAFGCEASSKRWIRIFRVSVHIFGAIPLLRYLKTANVTLIFEHQQEMKYSAYSEKKFCFLVRDLPQTTSQSDNSHYFEQINSEPIDTRSAVKGVIRARGETAIQRVSINFIEKHVRKNSALKNKKMKTTHKPKFGEGK